MRQSWRVRDEGVIAPRASVLWRDGIRGISEAQNQTPADNSLRDPPALRTGEVRSAWREDPMGETSDGRLWIEAG